MNLSTFQQTFGDHETTNVVGLGNEGMDEVSTGNRVDPTDVTCCGTLTRGGSSTAYWQLNVSG